MKGFKSLSRLIVACLLLVSIASTFAISCGEPEETTAATTTATTTPTTTATAVARSVLQNPQGYPLTDEDPQYGGTLVNICGMTLGNIGAPWLVPSGPNKFYARFAIEQLTGEDQDGQPVPQLATDWDLDPDAMTVTFTLREGVIFHDGTPFNADAVKWNLDMCKDASNPAMDLVYSIDVIDDNHIRLTLTGWDPLFLNNMASNCASMMVSPTSAEELGDEVVTHPVGTGPFEFVSFDPDVEVVFKAFDDYWQEGLPYLDGVEVQMVTDSVVRYTAFINGECHFLEGISNTQVMEAMDLGFSSSFMSSGIIGITWDSESTDSPFSDIRVRQAVAYAIPVETIVEEIFEGMYPYTNQFAAMVNGVAMAGYDSTIVGYPYDPDTALALLEDAGYGLDNPIETIFSYEARSEDVTDAYTAVQAELAKVGINITLDPQNSSAWQTFRTQPLDADHLMCDYNMSYQLAYPYSAALAQSLCAESSWFPSQYIPDEYETLYQTTVFETDMDLRADYYKQLNKMAVDEYCLALPMYCRTNYKGLAPNLHDMGLGNMSNEFDPSIIWLSE